MVRYRQQEREQSIQTTRQQLLKAAIAAFARAGYEQANINAISEEAGFAKGTVYNYFASKQDLLLAVIDSLGQEHFAYIAAEVRSTSSPLERLKRFYQAGFAFVGNHPAEAKVLITTLYSSTNQFREPMGKAYLPMFALVQDEIVKPGVEQGIFTSDNPTLTTSLLMTLYLGCGAQVDEQGTPLLQWQPVAEFALNALHCKLVRE